MKKEKGSITKSDKIKKNCKKSIDKERNLLTLDFIFRPTSVTTDNREIIDPEQAEEVLTDCMTKLTPIYNVLAREAHEKYFYRRLLKDTTSKNKYLKRYELVKEDIRKMCEKKHISFEEAKWPKIYWSEVDPLENWLLSPRMKGWYQRLTIMSAIMPYNMILNGIMAIFQNKWVIGPVLNIGSCLEIFEQFRVPNPIISATGYVVKQCYMFEPKTLPKIYTEEITKDKKWVVGPVNIIGPCLNIFKHVNQNPILESATIAYAKWTSHELKYASLCYFLSKYGWRDKVALNPDCKFNYSQASNYVGEEFFAGWESFFALIKNPKVKNRPPGIRENDFLTNIQYNGTISKTGQISGITLLPPQNQSDDWMISMSLGRSRPDKITCLKGIVVGSTKHQLEEKFSFGQIRFSMIKFTADSQRRFHCQMVVDLGKNTALEMKNSPLPNRWLERMTPDKDCKNIATKAAIDLGMKNIMSVVFDDCSQYIYTGRQLYASRYYWLKKRADVQKVNGKITPEDECHNKDKKFADNFFHQISNHLIKLCKEKGVKEIVMGDLTNIRHNKNGNDPSQQKNKYMKHSWSFAKLQNQITDKAKTAGIEVRKVSEAYSSQTCCACGAIHKPNRGHVKNKKRYTPKKNGAVTNRGNYHCFSDGNGGQGCGREFNSDLNGGVNIFTDSYGFNPWKERFESGDKASNTGIPGEAFIVRWERQPGVGAGLTMKKIT